MKILTYQFENRNQCYCIWDNDLWKNLSHDERSPVAGLELETPSRVAETLTTIPQPHTCNILVIHHADR